jgi:hypothetical protein
MGTGYNLSAVPSKQILTGVINISPTRYIHVEFGVEGVVLTCIAAHNIVNWGGGNQPCHLIVDPEPAVVHSPVARHITCWPTAEGAGPGTARLGTADLD